MKLTTAELEDLVRALYFASNERHAPSTAGPGPSPDDEEMAKLFEKPRDKVMKELKQRKK